jgi:hypothetical protein
LNDFGRQENWCDPEPSARSSATKIDRRLSTGAVRSARPRSLPRLFSTTHEGDVMVIRMVDQFVSGIFNVIGMLLIP